MLVHPWDAALDEIEWREWHADGHDFGQLAVNGSAGQPPTVVPTHFVVDEACLLVHLARPNPVWHLLERAPDVLMSVVDDYAFIPGQWRKKPGSADEPAVPTSYYAAVQFACRAEIVDDAVAKANLLRRQLAHFEPDRDPHDLDRPNYQRLLPGIRGLRLHIQSVTAKFKYDDQKPQTHRTSVAQQLAVRDQGRDRLAARQQLLRLSRIGTWRDDAAT